MCMEFEICRGRNIHFTLMKDKKATKSLRLSHFI